MSAPAGLTMVELLISLVIFGVVMVVLNGVFIGSNRLYGQTAVRAGQQMNERVALSVMTSELRTAGCDPTQAGIVSFVDADAATVHVLSDFSGDGAIQTAEPSEDITYTYDENARTLTRDPGAGAQVVMRNVSEFQLRYFDGDGAELVPPLTAAQRDLIRSVEIAVTTETRRGGEVTADTRVSLRNE
jgi:prepilin-type N-terminal cleavage/methylation domain-containing protein